MARRILRFQPPSFVSDEVCRPFPAHENSSATKVEMQAGNARGHGDETGDGAYGTKEPSVAWLQIPCRRRSERCPHRTDSSGAAAGPPPPMVICVPFAGTRMPVVLNVRRDGSFGVPAADRLWIANEPTGADRRRSILARDRHPHLHATLAAGAAHVVHVLRFGEHLRRRRRLESTAKREMSAYRIWSSG